MSDTITSISDVRDRLDGERTAMVTTLDERGTLSSRPVTVQSIDDSGDVWFLADRRAEWVGPADGAPINVAIVDDGDTWASFAGRAALVADQAVIDDMMDAFSSAFFGKDAEPIALRVATDRIEWWTAAGSVSQAVALIKAKLTDTEADVGDEGTIEV